MSSRLRSPSLLWTFAGAFLGVIVLSAVLQAVLVYRVVQPLTRQWIERDARELAQEAAHAIVIEFSRADTANAGRLLTDVPHDTRDFVLVYRDPAGDVHSDRPIPPGRARWWSNLLSDPALGDSLSAWRWRRDRELSSRRNGRTRARRSFSRTIFATAKVDLPAGQVGTVLAYSTIRDPLGWPPSVPRPGMLYLPVAALLAGGAGFWVFRTLTRRLRVLEAHAERVKAGDLSARVADPGPDEIGRLGRSLNEMTESLAEAGVRLENLEAQRRRFLADVTHELATPLTSIHGYAETLLDPKVSISSDERSTYLSHILTEAERMELLVRELLDLARLESGQTALELTELDWSELCRNSLRRFEPRFREAGLSLVWKHDADSAWVRADGRRLEQIMDNLLANALRYVSRGGRVEVSIERRDGHAALTVDDDGSGFRPEDLPHLFERFYRADAARTEGGAGLGLAIVREIVQLHGGSIRALNLGGDHAPRGARIEIELPLAEPAAAA